jgi:thiamine kinase-like enzyme
MSTSQLLFHSDPLAALQEIFPEEDVVRHAVIERIGGMTNTNFKVTLNNREYVLRLPGIGSQGMVVRRFEEQNSLYGCKLGISPNISYFNEETGIKLTDYIHHAETLNPTTIQQTDNMRQVARIFQTLHRSHICFSNDFNVFHELLKYEELMVKADGQMYQGYGDIRDKIFAMEERLNRIGIEMVACHNDAVPENFIKDENGKLFIIDWEYAGMNDPCWEIAALFLESNFTEDNQYCFLNFYYDSKIPQTAHEKIMIYAFLQDMLWAIWTVVKEAKGDDFGTYGIDRFKRGLKTLQKIEGIN